MRGLKAIGKIEEKEADAQSTVLTADEVADAFANRHVDVNGLTEQQIYELLEQKAKMDMRLDATIARHKECHRAAREVLECKSVAHPQ